MMLSALLKGVGVALQQDVEIKSITDKLSEVKNNSLFVCIEGASFDGNAFVKEAKDRGAAAIVSEKEISAPGAAVVRVQSSRKAYSIISGNFYGNPGAKLKLLGITGTNGKTTTAFIIRHILSENGKLCGITGTVKSYGVSREFSNTLTTPEPPELHKIYAEMVRDGCEYCVSEVSSQALSQYRTHGLNFLVGGVTNITPEHLDYHLNMENYISAKLSLFDRSSAAAVNIDDNNVQRNLDKIKREKITFSLKNPSADLFASDVSATSSGTYFKLNGNDAFIPLPGAYNVYNALCAAAVCTSCGIKTRDCIDALRSFSFVPGRCERLNVNCDFAVIIDYAHTPDGMENILTAAREFTNGRIITVFGCGGDRDKSKRAVMGRISSELSDVVIVTDDNPRTEDPKGIINDILKGFDSEKCECCVVPGRAKAIEYALGIAKKGDAVLLLGKGHETYQITAEGKIPFDEKEIIQEILSRTK